MVYFLSASLHYVGGENFYFCDPTEGQIGVLVSYLTARLGWAAIMGSGRQQRWMAGLGAAHVCARAAESVKLRARVSK